jgi:hypothetical protein
VTGSALTSMAWTAVNTEPARLAAALNGDRISSVLVEQVEDTIPRLRQLDDREGGQANLAYVHAQFQAVAMLLKQSSHGGVLTSRLLVALGELGQLAGWMAADTEQHGLAQRYYLTALRAAHNAADRALAANVLSMMAYHSASRERPGDAISLGTAAVEMAHRTSTTVQALVASRLAYGYALNGDLERFRTAYGRARELAEYPGAGYRPRWAYYVSGELINAACGSYLVSLARVRPAKSRPLLNEAATLLTPSASSPTDRLYQRDALLHGTWLASAYIAQGELEQACATGRTALARLPHVHSPRCVTRLRALADALRTRKLNAHVREFSTELDGRLQLVA